MSRDFEQETVDKKLDMAPAHPDALRWAEFYLKHRLGDWAFEMFQEMHKTMPNASALDVIKAIKRRVLARYEEERLAVPF